VRYWAARWARVAAGAIVLAAAVACGGQQQPPGQNRQWTDDLTITITPSMVPPRAAERIKYTVVVRDKKSGQPLDQGQGRMFATSRDKVNTWNGLQKETQPGEYSTTMFFPTAGEWAVALEFRRDSTQRLQRVDWMQEIRNATDSIH
jgi:hypothetical protein